MFEGQFCLEKTKIRTESSAEGPPKAPPFTMHPGGLQAIKTGFLLPFIISTNGNPLQYSCLEKPAGRGAWWATPHEVTKSDSHTHKVPLRYHLHTTFCANLKWWVFANISTWIIHIPGKIQNISNALKNSPLPSSWYTHFPQAIHGYCSDFYHHLCIPFLDICIHGMTQYRLTCVWLLPFNIMFLRFICIIVHHWFVTFYCWILFYCMILPQFAHPVSCWWTFGLLPGFDYHEKHYEHSGTNLFLGMFLTFLE